MLRTRDHFRRAESKFDQIANLARRRLLAKQLNLGKSELRRIEWSLQEATASWITSLRDFERRGFAARSENLEDGGAGEISRPEELTPIPASLAREKALASARKRALFERERAQRKILTNILDNAEAIATIEPISSLPDALRPIANELRAHYNDIKKRSKNQRVALTTNTLTDYWVSWAAVSSLLGGTTMDGRIVKYASKDMRDRIIRISKLAAPGEIPESQSSNWLGFERPNS